jgi:hypothetical protein
MADKTLTGGCLCGAVRYEVNGDPIVTAHCHCEHCRKTAGAGHTTIAAFPKSAVKMTGTLKTYRIKADSGMLTARAFCPECGSWMSEAPESMPDAVAITVATLDNPEALQPQMRFYEKRRISWDRVDPDLPAFATVPPM